MRSVALAAAVVAVALPVLPALANPNDPNDVPNVAAKQAQAARVLAQVDRLDAELGRAAEAYNGARLHLQQTTNALADNTRLLQLARKNLVKSRAAVAQRLVQLYTQGTEPTVVEVVLGASSLDDIVTRLDTQARIASEDARIADEVARFGESVRTRQQQLAAQKRTAARLEATLASRTQSIEGRLREREQMLASIRDEVARLREGERVRQAELARQVRARLAAITAATEAQQSPAGASPGAALDAQPGTGDAATTTTAAPAPAAPPSRYGGVVGIAIKYLGIPYRWGGSTPSGGFDCSGFTMYVYAQVGVSLPHYTGSQWQLGTAVARDDLQPGDLVFFDGLGHEGIYIGGNQMIHAPRTGDVVKISSITGWYATTYMGARRL